MQIRRLIKAVTVLALIGCFCPATDAGAQSSGREFWLAIPPNEFDGSHPTEELEILVSSPFDTDVTLQHPGSGYQSSKHITAGQTVRFTTADGSANWLWEVRDDERVGNQGVYITADEPVVVSVLNCKAVSSDGYTAIPINAWGMTYTHLGFYDFGEFSSTSPWGGGFVIVAGEDNTKVVVTLKGVDNGNPVARTKRDRSLGAVYNVSLQRGQTYMVRGNGQTLNEFDISGTEISANKPVGVLSFHQRTMIPSFPSPNNGRNHLVEMLPPTSTWKKEHVSLEFNREKNRGDFFRIIAAEADTRFTCRYTDLATGETYTWEGVLNNAGDFMEKENTWPPSTSIKGAAVWTSDKPTLVMQYAYSGAWDDAVSWDPFMVQVVPVDNYTNSALFSTPGDVDFTNNFLTLIAIGDPTDSEQKLLKSIRLNGQPVWELTPTILGNRIQQTPYYWTRIKVPHGTSRLSGDTRFGGMLYGTSTFNGYGWPVASAEAGSATDVPEVVTGPHIALAAEPNPFAETIRMRYTLPVAGRVRLELYTTTGEKVRLLAEGEREAGTHIAEAPVDGLASGVYLCRLECGGETATLQVRIVQ